MFQVLYRLNNSILLKLLIKYLLILKMIRKISRNLFFSKVDFLEQPSSIFEEIETIALLNCFYFSLCLKLTAIINITNQVIYNFTYNSILSYFLILQSFVSRLSSHVITKIFLSVISSIAYFTPSLPLPESLTPP